MRYYLYCHIPKSHRSTESLILDSLMLRQQQILQLTVNVSMLCIGCLLVREAKVPCTEDLMTVEIRRTVNRLDESGTI